jgi:hypothetical protein|tara:strand:- start:93 stop:344 length:252 start_codon:yes stop_codon:yes gene_type:complete
MKYFVISNKTVTANTAEYGFGDYFDRDYFLNLVVEADTKRKAMNKARKIDSHISFSGINSDFIFPEGDESISVFLRGSRGESN